MKETSRSLLSGLALVAVLLNPLSISDVGSTDIIHRDGFDPCLNGVDLDNDRLDDCAERALGTDPFLSDTDGDSIDDGDEVLGTPDGLDLRAMGADPLVKNILLEYDWFEDDLDVPLHAHRPTQAMIDRVAATFAAAPVTNPDGSSGIVVIQDFGQGGVFTGGNLIDDPNGVLVGGVLDEEFQGYKSDHFAANRRGYFHYVLLPHRYDTDSSSSGQAELIGDDMIVSLYEYYDNVVYISNTIVHELGHNLGLLHGGDAYCNYKPNYNSVMNYRYQFPGVDNNCSVPGDGVLDYSSGTYVSLDENNLDEDSGICGDVAIDWNDDGQIQAGVSADLNPNGNFSCGATLTTLRDHNDWASIVFAGVTVSNRRTAEVIECTSSPTEAGH
ncbi:MAG: hypothetical protein V2J19_06700 [Wenzhouxiangella sp.]|jgi:hypothetical protein|nr:hypothetical protein [Wenzhouxiangella sp.]